MPQPKKGLRGFALFRNESRGEFTDVSKDNAACPTEFGGRSAAVLDYDGDGLLDILVGEDPLPGYNGSTTKTSRLFRNRGNLKFADVSHESGIPQDAAGLGVAAADVNNDGWPDFFLASTLGNYLMLNDGAGRFREAPGSHETFAWPLAKGDDMVCGVAFGDVNRDGLLDVVIGQHFKQPWVKPVANRLYLNRGIKNGVPSFEDVTEKVGLVPLPLKGPHVEIQDFDNDGWPDIYVSIVKFANEGPHPVIFKHFGIQNDLPQFRTDGRWKLTTFPQPKTKPTLRTGEFFEKMIRERKIIYTAPGPSGDYDNDGRLDLFLANWWKNSPSMLLHNETSGGHWLDVRIEGSKGVNRQGVGARINIYSVNQLGQRKALLGSREIGVGFGYASGQPAIAPPWAGRRRECRCGSHLAPRSGHHHTNSSARRSANYTLDFELNLARHHEKYSVATGPVGDDRSYFACPRFCRGATLGCQGPRCASSYRRCAIDGDATAFELDRGELVEDDGPAAGFSYQPNEELLAKDIWLRKQLVVDDPRADR